MLAFTLSGLQENDIKMILDFHSLRGILEKEDKERDLSE